MQKGKHLAVDTVLKDSQAEKVGLKENDIIVSYDGNEITGDPLSLLSVMQKTEGRDHVVLNILRDGKPMALTVNGGKLGITLKTPDEETIASSFDFKTLLGFGKFISGCGWIVLIFGVLAILVGIGSGEDEGFLLAGGALLAVLMGLGMVAFGQLISCFVAIEKNTRGAYKILKQQWQ